MRLLLWLEETCQSDSLVNTSYIYICLIENEKVVDKLSLPVYD